MAAPGLVDTHAHLMDAAFDDDRLDVVARARAAGLAALVVVGYDLPTSRAAVELARTLPLARASVGIHPNSAAEASAAEFEAIAALAREPEVVAIGETGLDYYRRNTPPGRQRDTFEWHLRLAEELSLPVIVHNRQADADIADLLTAATIRRASPESTGYTNAANGALDRPPGILHCFSSTDPAFLGRLVEAGYFASFAGPLTFKTADDLRSMASRVPLDRLLVETDCPYLAPVPHRGRRNEPAFVRDTAACLAGLVGLSFDALVERLWINTVRVFPSFAHAPWGVA